MQCDQSDKVVCINWKGYGLYGKLPLRHLPVSICEVVVSENYFTGVVDLDLLPPGLRMLIATVSKTFLGFDHYLLHSKI